MKNKALLLLTLATFIFLFQLTFISASLCKGSDGYYNECDYYRYDRYDGQNYRTVIDLSKSVSYDYDNYDSYRYNSRYNDDYDYNSRNRGDLH